MSIVCGKLALTNFAAWHSISCLLLGLLLGAESLTVPVAVCLTIIQACLAHRAPPIPLPTNCA